MEKTIEIDGKKVKFKATGVTPLRFKAQFKKDFYAAIFKLLAVDKMLLGQASAQDLGEVDTETAYQMIWIMAKEADKSIPPLMDWLESFDEFPFFEVWFEASQLLQGCLHSTKKK